MQVLHVCSHWYHVGLNSPNLWTVICGRGGAECLQTFVFRSQGLPLCIYSEDTTHCDVPYIIPALSHVRTRIKALCLKVPRGLQSLFKPCFRALKDAGPAMLENLDIEVPLPNGRLGNTDCWEVHLDDIFSRNFPFLRRLCIVGYSSMNGTILASNLRMLHLEGLDGHGGIEIPDLLLSLRNMSSLHELILSYALNFETSTGNEDLPICNLPSLSWLAMYDTGSNCSVVLKHLVMPNRTEVELDCDLTSPEESSALSLAIQSLFFQGEPHRRTIIRDFRSLTIAGSTSSKELLIAGCGHAHNSLRSGLEFDCCDPNFYIHINCQDYLRTFSDLLGILPLSGVEMLHIGSDGDVMFPDLQQSRHGSFIPYLPVFEEVTCLEMSLGQSLDDVPLNLPALQETLPKLKEIRFV